mgnify:CR=1 FL=1
MSKYIYADRTLKSWTKAELFHQIRILERNLAVKQELVNNQAKLLEAWAPVVHGEWITIDGISRCSECGYIPAYDSAIDDLFYSPFCSNCGAKMDGRGKK